MNERRLLRGKITKNSRGNRVALSIGVCYSIVLFVVAFRMHFAILSNDSLPLAFQARHLEFENPASLFNGFFPIGYPLLLKFAAMLGDRGMNTSVLLLQCVLGGCYASLTWTLSRKFMGYGLASAVTVVAIFIPEFVRYELSATPDFICALLIATAMASFIQEKKSAFVRAGTLIGLASLFRTHALAFLGALVVAELLLDRSRDGLRGALQILKGAFPLILAQGLIHIVSGHGFFETMQNFNVWKMMHGEDWARPAIVTKGTLGIVLDEPGLFFSRYVNAFGNVLWLFLVFLGAFRIGMMVRPRQNRLWRLFFAAGLYLLIITAGASARAAFPVLLLGLVGIGWSLSNLPIIRTIVEDRTVSRWLAIGSILVAIVASVMSVRSTDVPRARVEEYDRISAHFGVKHETDARTIFTDDFALYFPSIANATPVTMGGWASVGLPVYQHEMPRIDDSSPEHFLASLKNAGIRSVVIREPALDEKVANYVTTDTADFRRLESTSSSHIVYSVR